MKRYVHTLFFLVLLGLVGCQGQVPLLVAVDEPARELPTLMPTVPPLATAVPLETTLPEPAATPELPPTFTPEASRLPTQTPSATPSPTSTPGPTPTPTNTPEPTPSPVVDRTCPDPVPLKPEYAYYYLSGTAWPTPNPAMSETHFWLTKPLPGGGRYLINDTYPYGWDLDGRLLLHNAVDTAGGMGTPVLAAAPGTVVVAQSDMYEWYGWRCDWYGHLVVVQHDDLWYGQPVFTLYGHVLNINVESGQHVERGEQVAEIGIGGASSAPHLHFEVRIGSNDFTTTRNPMLWVDPGETRGVIAGRLIDPQKRPWQGVTIHLLDEDGTIVATTWSYLDDPLHYINPDEGLAENFLFSDVIPGTYTVYTELQDVIYQVPVVVEARAIATVEIVTEPYKPTPSDE
ncbi:MAG: peptidoglycan DD-metalloendopeptidase family protein [Ardenticatenaceae bacterium]|nr:peptidoglycan DD-metalloendopeptidase family protein [Anaerolineales bacterium]MCB8921582.1 peptidoglycan DD-metalloendopeptidase family protein [Ardenticatenaceae bacterium]MCB9003881.1 peptidoglycan DD-metalloendopeptidase family protein [Ardenticatenaceae bacterium]